VERFKTGRSSLRGVRLEHIQQDNQHLNAYVERFNRTVRYDTSGCDCTTGVTWRRFKTSQPKGCGLTTMTDPTWPWGGGHTKAATGHGCIRFLLLRPLQKGRITVLVEAKIIEMNNRTNAYYNCMNL
jgi:hypothetical protein